MGIVYINPYTFLVFALVNMYYYIKHLSLTNLFSHKKSFRTRKIACIEVNKSQA